MAVPTLVFLRLLLLAPVLLTIRYAVSGIYPLAAMFALTLVVYGYLIYFGDRPIERRLLGRPGPPKPPEE